MTVTWSRRSERGVIFTTKLELVVARESRHVLRETSIGETIADSAEYRNLLSSLERYLPELLREVHPEWERESLDGVYPEIARKTAEYEIEIGGLCILITDQTLAPLQVRLQLDPLRDEITWVACRVGEVGPEGMVRTPYKCRLVLARPLEATDWKAIEWAYHVGFGERHRPCPSAEPQGRATRE